MTKSIENEFISSIGAVWPPVVSSNERVKGFFDELITDQYGVNDFVGEYRCSEDQMRSQLVDGRLTLRALATLDTVPLFENHGLNVEAALPVRDQPLLNIIYLATNDPNRIPNDTTLASHRSLLDSIVKRPTDTNSNLPHLLDMGYKVVCHKSEEEVTDSLRDKFVTLYRAFGYSGNEVIDLLKNPANRVLYVEDEDGIASTVLSEHVQLQIKGHGALDIIEISEAITREDVRGRGLYRALSGVLTEHLVSDIGVPRMDVLYGESNLAMYGVLMAAHQNGRKFSHYDRQRLEVCNINFGILQQNFKVADGTTTMPYNDFAVSYIPLEKSE